MNLSSADQTLQFIAWFIALIEFILALYVLLLNPRHTANRHVSSLLLFISANSFALGLLIGAGDAAQAALPTYVLAATSAAVGPLILLVSIAVLKPHWLPGRAQEHEGPSTGGGWRWILLPVYVLAILPLLLTLLDLGLGTRLWYSGLDAATYHGGYVGGSGYRSGSLSLPIRVLNFYLTPIITIIPLLYLALLDKKMTSLARRLAWLFLGVQVAVVALRVGMQNLLPEVASVLITNAVIVLAYAYAAFRQMISERRAQGGRLQTRLTVLILVIAVPLFVAVVVFMSAQAGEVIERKADEQLEVANRALTANLSTWLDLNVQLLQQLVSLPDVISMDAEQQKPVLEAMATAHPHIHLISTVDLNGTNVARSDDEIAKDYSTDLWFKKAKDEASLTFQVLRDPDSGELAMVASMPIRDESGAIVGVGMFSSDLTDIARTIQAGQVGESGVAYVVDGDDRAIAHPDIKLSAESDFLSASPPIVALRDGTRGLVTFADQEGKRWRAYVDELENGWGVVVQQRETELLDDLRALWAISGMVVVFVSIVLLALTWLTVRQAFQPIGTLTDTATAIAAGDLTRVAPVESEDEIGLLARTFNRMTDQLRGLIGSLEEQVAERTQDLEKRSAYLEATAEVGRVATSILETDQLIQQVVELIRERFGLYYVGLFLVDEAREWAVLRAGTGVAGQIMLARGHRIKVGTGMIGWSIAHAQPRVALEAGEDAVRLATAELPETRSETALPLRSRGQVLGALSVQHTLPGAFDQDTLAVLQTMADQVAVALDNARLFAEGQAALEVASRAYGELGLQAWNDLLRTHPEWGYRFAQKSVSSVEGDWQSEMLQAVQTGQSVQRSPELAGSPSLERSREIEAGSGAEGPALAIPLKVRDQVVGALSFRKEKMSDAWTAEEVALLETLSEQLSMALENARLYQDTQRRAARQRVVSEVAARIRESLDLETVLKTTATEMRQVLGVEEFIVSLTTDGGNDSDISDYLQHR
jgi:GAF domain-containing protein/HAMP domain-containing protein